MVDAKDPLNNLTEKQEQDLKQGIALAVTERKWSFRPANGEIKTYESKELLEEDLKTMLVVSIDRPPAKNCKTCYGRGYEGRDIRTNIYLPCGCLFSRRKK